MCFAEARQSFFGTLNCQGKSREQKSKKDPHLDTTMKLSNMKEDNLFSESGSESDESCYSSDFTRYVEIGDAL